MTDLHSLLTRVEAATGPDRELDNMIRCALYEPAKRGMWLPYTASLDAALALVGEKLPGEYIDIGGLSIPAPTAEPDWQATIGPWLGGGLTPALALLSALLRALIAKQEVEDG